MKNNLRMISVLFALTAILSFTALIFAQDGNNAKHPIDIAQNECLKTHHGTMPRAKCYSDASDAWDRDISKTYTELLQKINSTDKKSLEASQTDWEKYRDAEFDFIGHLYNQKKGTGYISVRIIERMEIVKNRALELESRLETVKNSNGGN